MEGKGTEKRPEMFMIYRNVIAATIVVTVCILAGSNAMAQRHGGFSGGGFRGGGSAFGRTGFNSGGFRGGFNGHGFRGDRFRHRDFGDRFVFFGDFGSVDFLWGARRAAAPLRARGLALSGVFRFAATFLC